MFVVVAATMVGSSFSPFVNLKWLPNIEIVPLQDPKGNPHSTLTPGTTETDIV